MNLIEGRTILVTGASSGIGEARARSFASRGARLVLGARRMDRLTSLQDELTSSGAQVHVHPLDVRDRDAVAALERELADANLLPDVIINNAGLSRGLDPIHEGHIDDWEEMIDTNVKGLFYVTRAFLPHMVAADHGHVVNIGSTAGHLVYPRGNVYNATKFAVNALSHATSIDLVGTQVRVSTVDPGLVETDFSTVRFRGDKERAAKNYRGITPLAPADVAEAVLWVVDRPPHVNVREVVLMPTAQRNAYVVHKEES
jgi:3-hydroxy acid dehydrogenase/malonic semialdehyde reductase